MIQKCKYARKTSKKKLEIRENREYTLKQIKQNNWFTDFRANKKAHKFIVPENAERRTMGYFFTVFAFS